MTTPLDYAPLRSGKGVTVAWCADAMEAELLCNALRDGGVAAVAVNQHTVAALQGYVGFVKVEVQVAVEDREAAAEVLARLPGRNDVEPAEDPADGSADFATDASGARVRWRWQRSSGRRRRCWRRRRRWGRLASSRSSRTSCRAGPTRPGKCARRRGSACGCWPTSWNVRSVLEESQEERGEGTEDEPRCPECASWRVYGSSPGIFASLAGMFTGRGSGGKTWQCLRCRHKWAATR